MNSVCSLIEYTSIADFGSGNMFGLLFRRIVIFTAGAFTVSLLSIEVSFLIETEILTLIRVGPSTVEGDQSNISAFWCTGNAFF